MRLNPDKILAVGMLTIIVLGVAAYIDNELRLSTPNREVHGTSGSERHVNAVQAYGLHDVQLGSPEFIRCGAGTDSYEFTAKNISETPVHGVVCCGFSEMLHTCKVKY